MAFDGEELDGVALPRWHPDGDAHANFGDELGPILVRAIRGAVASGAESSVERPSDDRRLISIGSVLHFARRGDIVWGAGINGKVKQRLTYPLDVRAVRGPYTRAVLLGHGIETPEVYGDPALLLPRFFPEAADGETHGDEAVVPNLNDRARFDGDGVVDPLGAPLAIVRHIAGASFVIASSLHALIIADAFGVPSRPVLSESEHPFKYVDYYAGTGRRGIRFASSIEHARELGPVEPAEFDREALLAAFPHDLWSGDGEPREVRSHAALRRASASAIADVTRGYEYEETTEEALALTRAVSLIGGQDPLALSLFDRAHGGDEDSTADAARALYWFLRKGPERDTLDARAIAAVQLAAACAIPTPRDEVLWRLVGAEEIVLARAIAREHVELDEGIARARALGGWDEPAPSEAAGMRGIGRRLRRIVTSR